MCTDKQLAFVKLLSEWKGKKVDLDNVAKKENGEVSQFIDELKALPSVKKKGRKSDEVELSDNLVFKEEKVNEPRFGMCFKIVVSRYDTGTLVRNTADIIEDVIAMYQLAGNAHNAIEMLVSGVEE